MDIIEDIAAPAGRGRGPRRRGTAAQLAQTAAEYGAAASEALAETLWPTRCAVCDTPGEVLCEDCRQSLPYLDWWRACPRCGAPLGRVQCTECNAVMMEARGREEPPFAGCASATLFEDAPARIVRTWKDAGERRLAPVMAQIMARVVPPAWLKSEPVVVPIPASSRAMRSRGFDHGAELASAVAEELRLQTAQPLARPRARDQRKLGGRERAANMEGRFQVLPGAQSPPEVLLVDDVYTTGSTLFSATDALMAAGAERVHCLTFTRVW